MRLKWLTNFEAFTGIVSQPKANTQPVIVWQCAKTVLRTLSNWHLCSYEPTLRHLAKFDGYYCIKAASHAQRFRRAYSTHVCKLDLCLRLSWFPINSYAPWHRVVSLPWIHLYQDSHTNHQSLIWHGCWIPSVCVDGCCSDHTDWLPVPPWSARNRALPINQGLQTAVWCYHKSAKDLHHPRYRHQDINFTVFIWP